MWQFQYILDVSYHDKSFHIQLVFFMGRIWKLGVETEHIELAFLHVKKIPQKIFFSRS
jgi:hypothetical protein